MNTLNLPLFPLNTVLFPGGPLPLRIFEPRYLDMVSASVKQDKPFGVCLIKRGEEAGHAAEPHTIGTLAKIVDWDQLTDGTLGITARGGERFLVEHYEVQQNQLTVGAVSMIPDDPIVATPAEYSPLIELLRHLLPQAGDLYSDVERDFDNASWLGCRLAEILPIDLPEKQALLELTSPLQRLKSIDEVLHQLRERQPT
ncbi:MAG: LON peptidase substrate-binding domain-containing protein [Gammaproteobacteria bacterium]|nr:LON peptidase substrate-binding domain-containing protein [Gammaproteobacteria bacterium]MDH3467382.1 LON peptidase substrate-binding domain-containing protein [Gammaproteobacteria bacterium]